MARRKNTNRIDPRWFMDEKTEVLKESRLVDAIIQIINDSPIDEMDDLDLHHMVKKKFPQLTDDQIDAAMNNKKLNPYYDALEGVYSKKSLDEKTDIIKEEEIVDLSNRLLDVAGEMSVLASRADGEMKNILINLQGQLEAIASKIR
tara:strand:- start:352 stop:792 length:441 start_codon:yes stop_codon:yes gene_type:complete